MGSGASCRITRSAFRVCSTSATMATAGTSLCLHWRATAICSAATRIAWRLVSDYETGSHSSPSPQPPPARGGGGVACARIGIVVGLAAEARIARRLDRSVAIGGGMVAGAESAVRRLIDEGADALISLGLAGGLEPALRPGALIVPSAVIADDKRYPADPTLMQWLGGSTSHLILGADAVVASAAEKRRLRERTSAAAVDLESGAVARAAAMHGLPFAVLRAICDPAER